MVRETGPFEDSKTESTPPPGELQRNRRWSSYANLLTARLKEIWREPQAIFWVYVFPLIVALSLGIAFRNKPLEAISIAIVSSSRADEILSTITNRREKPAVQAEILSEKAALEKFRMGKFDLVVLPAAKDELAFRYDPSRPESLLARTIVNDAVQGAAGRKDPIPTQFYTSTEPGSRYVDFVIPGLLGMNLLNSGLWGIGFTLVDVRQRKLLKRFAATPMRRIDYVLALTSSRLIFMLMEMVIFLGLGLILFHMPILGSPVSVLLLCIIGSVTFSGLGLLTASRAQDSGSASGLINLVSLPMWMLSGVFFSYERFPGFMHPLIRSLPLTALIDGLRTIILEGAPLSSQVGRLTVLSFWAGVSWMLGLRWFRWS